jgi:hypothetical protein
MQPLGGVLLALVKCECQSILGDRARGSSNLLKIIGNFILKARGAGKMKISGDSDLYESALPGLRSPREDCSHRAEKRIKPKESPLDENPAAGRLDDANLCREI